MEVQEEEAAMSVLSSCELSSFSLPSLPSSVTGNLFSLLQYFLSSGICCLFVRRKKIVEK